MNATPPTTPVTEWYGGKSVFITGGSGFMGKVLLEKLLYACPKLERIYLLLRSKKGRSPHQRIEDMWKSPMFERLKKTQPDAFKKLVPLAGDVITDNLGLNESSISELVENVNVVFHMAATLRLEANLKDALEQNTRGTVRVIEIAKKIKKLEAFLYFSTAFCSADIDVFEERIYDYKDDPNEVLRISNWLSDKSLEQATPSIIAPHPNTYTYSKRLAEILVAAERDNMPVCIIRPSIVIPAVQEPLPGWVDNLNGPIGLLVGAGKGVIRSMHCKGENKGQFIPVDYAINTSIVIGYLLGANKIKSDEVPVYNLTLHPVLPITYKEIMDQGRDLLYANPFEMQVWYPDGDIRSSKLFHNIYSFFFQWIPALLIDFLMLILCQKRFMIRIQKKIYHGLELLQFFSTREWIFKSEKFLSIGDYLTEEEKVLFPMTKLIPLKEYLLSGLLGVRQYCLKEDLSSLPRCRRKQKLLYVLHKCCVYGFYFYIFYLLSHHFRIVKNVYDFLFYMLSLIPFIGFMFSTN